MPMVLLTLLSIIQALALELTWHHLLESAYLFRVSWVAMLMWTQIVTTLLGILLIWQLYSSMVMRQARLDGENESFFATVPPATLRDFVPTFAVCASLVAIGLALHISEHRGIFALIGVLAAAVAVGH